MYMENQKITPETMTKIVFQDYKEVSFGKTEADSWIVQIGKRIGNNLHFKIYRFSDEIYKFLVGLFDEKDNVIVDMYLADQWCGFKMKTEFYHELLKMLKTIHKSKNIKKIPTELPIFIATGKDDPVGSYGKTVEKLLVIKDLLYTHGLTIAGVKKLLRDGNLPSNTDDILNTSFQSQVKTQEDESTNNKKNDEIELAITLLKNAKTILQ